MNEQPVKVDRVSWQNLFPWMIIFRTLPVATSATVLILAILGVLVTPVGWLLSESLFINDALRDNEPFLAEVAEINRSPYKQPITKIITLRSWVLNSVVRDSFFSGLFNRSILFLVATHQHESSYISCSVRFGPWWSGLLWALGSLGSVSLD